LWIWRRNAQGDTKTRSSRHAMIPRHRAPAARGFARELRRIPRNLCPIKVTDPGRRPFAAPHNPYRTVLYCVRCGDLQVLVGCPPQRSCRFPGSPIIDF